MEGPSCRDLLLTQKAEPRKLPLDRAEVPLHYYKHKKLV